MEIWVNFHELHVEPLLEHTDAVWVAPVPATKRGNNMRIGEHADLGGVEANDEVEECRHPFGLLNPPDKIWQAHRRLVLGEGGSKEQELVDTFAVKNAYYGNGLGKQESMSRCFQVGRPRYCPSLAKQRRKNKQLESK